MESRDVAVLLAPLRGALDVQDIVRIPPFVLSEMIAVNYVRFRILGNLPTYCVRRAGFLWWLMYWHFQAKGYSLIFLTLMNSRFVALKSNHQSSKGVGNPL